MHKIIVIFAAAITCLTGCDLGKQERNAAEATYKANAVARKQCTARLQGMKHVPIAGTGGKLYLDSEKLSMWSLSRDFKVGDECGAEDLGDMQTFYWDGTHIISKHNWIYRDKKSPWLIDKSWISISALVFLGIPSTCNANQNNTRHNCKKLPPDKNKNDVIQLIHHPLDAWPVHDPRRNNELLFYQLSLRDWPNDNGWPRTLRYACELSDMSESEVVNINFNNDNKHRLCQLDFSDFKFKAGTARINFDIKNANQITTVLKEFQMYLNDAIYEEKQL